MTISTIKEALENVKQNGGALEDVPIELKVSKSVGRYTLTYMEKLPILKGGVYFKDF